MAWPETPYPEPQVIDYGFQDGAALRQIVDVVNRSPINLVWDHSDRVRDLAGCVESAAWEPAGDIPAGVNATLVVFPEYDAKAAAGLQFGLLRVGSISIDAELVPSHPELPITEFLGRQGTEVNGQIVRWLPVNIRNVAHFAFVSVGADEYAAPRRTGIAHSGRGSELVGLSARELLLYMARTLRIAPDLVRTLQNTAHATDAVSPDLSGRILAAVDAMMADAEAMPAVAVQLDEVLGILKAGKSVRSQGSAGQRALAVVRELRARLPVLMESAAQIDGYVQILRNEAISWYDRVHADPTKDQMLSSACLVRRPQIQDLRDIRELQRIVEEHKPLAEARFGPVKNLRSSIGEELPPDPALVQQQSRHEQFLREGFDRLFGKGK